MARTMTGAAVGRVNRRFLFLALILAALSAILVYAAVTKSNGGTATSLDIKVVFATQSIPAGTILTAEMLSIRDASEDSVGLGFFTSTESALGKLVQFPIAANATVLNANLVGTTGTPLNDSLNKVILETTRGMAISVDSVTAAGGLVLPGDHVDVYWVPADDTEILADHVGAMLIAENIEVLAVETVILNIAASLPGTEDETGEAAAGDGRIPGETAELIPQATTVTLMLTSAQVQQIFCAEMGGQIRLAVRRFQDSSPTGIQPSICVLKADTENQP